MEINYCKVTDKTILDSIKNRLIFSKIQNFQPIYQDFFKLNETNFNNIQFNSKYHLHSDASNEHSDIWNIKNNKNNDLSKTKIFFKEAPLLNPFNYLMGKIENNVLHHLPSLDNNPEVHDKIITRHNSSYTESFFIYLSSKLLNEYNFVHGIEYYGSYLGIKENFKFDVYEDLDYLVKSNHFIDNKNKSFFIDEYEDIIQCESNIIKKIPIEVTGDIENPEIYENFKETFENIFNEEINEIKDEILQEIDINFTENDSQYCSLKNVSLSSRSSCSSRTSYTSNGSDEDSCSGSETGSKSLCSDDDSSETVTSMGSSSTIKLNACIPFFPINLICMEHFEGTLEDLIINDELNEKKWFACLMQIIMNLLVYQTAFSFTHNDLHTNNIMYKKTKRKFIYYKYDSKFYKVPTFGKIFSIIDFGRSIYKCKGNIYCSDAFDVGGDANTQYNTEPFLNNSKPRLEPNYSFDLCRLACSIFDFLVEDIEDLESCKCSVTKLIVEWCSDDNNNNVLYKKNGDDRYPDFKLYKMIARRVNKHTPQLQLKRPSFQQYQIDEIEIDTLIDIDHLKLI